MTRRDLLLLILAFVITRAALVGAGVIALRYYPPNEGAEFTHLIDGGAALDLWYRWDAGFYATIATDGYDWLNTRQPADDMAFLPLYPLAIHLVSGLTPTGCLASPYLSTCATVGGADRLQRRPADRAAAAVRLGAAALRQVDGVAGGAAAAGHRRSAFSSPASTPKSLFLLLSRAGLLAAGAGSLRLGGARGDLRLPDPLGRRGAGSGAAVVRMAAIPSPPTLSHVSGARRSKLPEGQISELENRTPNSPILNLNTSRRASLLPSLKSGRGEGGIFRLALALIPALVFAAYILTRGRDRRRSAGVLQDLRCDVGASRRDADLGLHRLFQRRRT